MKRTIGLAAMVSLAALLGAARPARADLETERAMREAPAAAQWSQRYGADRAEDVARSVPVGIGSSATTSNTANATVGNSTAAAASERFPDINTENRKSMGQ